MRLEDLREGRNECMRRGIRRRVDRGRPAGGAHRAGAISLARFGNASALNGRSRTRFESEGTNTVDGAPSPSIHHVSSHEASTSRTSPTRIAPRNPGFRSETATRSPAPGAMARKSRHADRPKRADRPSSSWMSPIPSAASNEVIVPLRSLIRERFNVSRRLESTPLALRP